MSAIRLSQRQRALLAAVGRGEVTYRQFTGAFGGRFVDPSGERIATPSVEALQHRGLIAWVPLSVKMGGPADYTLRLTSEGQKAIA